MAKQYKNIHPVKYYRDYLSHNIRPDGRDLLNFRPIIMNIGNISTADGSAIVKIGETTVVCGIKAELAMPKAEEADKGFLVPNVELPPMCAPKFRPGPPSDQAQVTSQVVNDIILSSKFIDLKDLCIAPGKLVWVLYCDIVCLNHDGALTDACVLAIIAAFKTVTLPEVKYNAELDTKIVDEENRKSIPMQVVPVATTFAIFENSELLADPTSEEESLCVGIITITFVKNNICTYHKPGGLALSREQTKICTDLAEQRWDSVKEILDDTIKTYEKQQNY